MVDGFRFVGYQPLLGLIQPGQLTQALLTTMDRYQHLVVDSNLWESILVVGKIPVFYGANTLLS